MPRAHAARPPAPAISGIEPASVVIRRPAPWVVAHPRPSIPINPCPASVAIRRPADRHIGLPHVTVRCYVHPRSMAVQILGAIHVAADIVIAARALELP